MPCLNGKRPSAFIVDPHFDELSARARFGEELNAMVQFCLEHGEELATGETAFSFFSEIRGMQGRSQAALAGRSDRLAPDRLRLAAAQGQGGRDDRRHLAKVP